MTAAANLKKRALAGLKRVNPDAVDLTIKWDGRVRKIKYPTGYVGLQARGILTATGYEPSTVTAECDLNGNNFSARTWSASNTRALLGSMLERKGVAV